MANNHRQAQTNGWELNHFLSARWNDVWVRRLMVLSSKLTDSRFCWTFPNEPDEPATPDRKLRLRSTSLSSAQSWLGYSNPKLKDKEFYPTLQTKMVPEAS